MNPYKSYKLSISAALHSVFTHLESKDSYVTMLFVVLSSAFNTISPMEADWKTLWA